MANSLGTLGEFQIDPNQDPSTICGMRYSGVSIDVPPPTQGGEPPLVGAGHGAELQAALEKKLAQRPVAEPLSAQEIAERFKDIEAALARLERAKQRGQDTGALIAQLRNEQFSVLTGEFIQLKRAETRKVLEGMMRPTRRRQVTMIDLNLFEAVANARVLATEVSTASQDAFPGVARKVLDILRASWPREEFPSGPGLSPEGSE